MDGGGRRGRGAVQPGDVSLRASGVPVSDHRRQSQKRPTTALPPPVPPPVFDAEGLGHP